MDKQIEATVSKFTPCPDLLVEKYSHTTALVWGKVWRYCQMKDGVCKAAIDRLAKELNMSDVTVGKHIQLLEDGKYIKDLTPDVRNKPHEYIDTGKLKLRITIFMEEEEGTKKFGTEKLGSDYQKTWHEESTTTTSLFSAYENNIGPITTMVADSLQDAEKTYPLQWITDAIKLAVENNKRNWRYCETILKRWQADGKDDGKKHAEKQAPVPDMGDFEKRYGF
jgi:DnaD/phage-associated family protein